VYKRQTLNRKDWIVIGLFYSENDSTNPGKIKVNRGQFIDNVNIDCDFNNPPPQPPGGLRNLNKIVYPVFN
jgi:hypothetical protein